MIQRCFLCLLLVVFGKCLPVAPNTVVATISVGTDPIGIAVTPNNAFVYVVNTADSTVSMINAATKSVVKTIIGFDSPYSIAINPAGTLAYVTNTENNTISIVSLATNTVADTIVSGDFVSSRSIVISPDGLTAYVGNYASAINNNVVVVDLISNVVTGTIVVGEFVSAVAISPNGKYLYAASYNTGTNDGTLSVIDTNNNTVQATITGFFGPQDIAITPDNNFAYVTNFGNSAFTPVGNTVSVVNLNTNTIVDTITVGIEPAGIAITPDGALVYVTNYNNQAGAPGEGTVNVIASASDVVFSSAIAVQTGPIKIAISPNGEYAYVVNNITNSVSVIALQSFQIAAQACRTANVFLTQDDVINKITWSTTGGSLPLTYAIYRNSSLTDLAVSMPANEPLVFFDHNRSPNSLYTYYLVGTNAVGTTSMPLSVTVSSNCYS